MSAEDIGIYELVCLVSGKRYIGSSISLKSRFRAHKCDLKHDRHPNKFLQQEWNSFGEREFIFNVLEICEKEVLFKREAFHIKKNKTKVYNTHHSEKKDKDGFVGKDLPGTKRYRIY